MDNAVNAILAARLLAVIRLDRYDSAVEVAQALLAGGISILEFTLTGEGAYAAIAAVRAALGGAVTVGVGTVLHGGEASRAVDAGAQFAVTPAVRPGVIAACQARGLPILCGAFTPTEALAAHEAGADLIKIFPARALGPQYIRDLLAPLPQLRLVPTGGLGPENLGAYLEAGAAAVAVGGNLVPRSAAERGDWAQITAQARACVAALPAVQARRARP